METTNEIKAGDQITSNGRYNLANYFSNGALQVKRIEEVDLAYAGDAIVYCDYAGKEIGFYINGLKNVKLAKNG